MNIVWYLMALLGLYGLYAGKLLLGSIAFCVGGLLAGKLFPSLRSSGVVLLAVSTAYGYHNAYTPLVFFLIFVGFVLACFHPSGTAGHYDAGWGFDIDFSDSGSGAGCGSDSGSDGCGGGDGGGGE